MTNEETKLEALSNGIFGLIYLYATTQTEKRVVIDVGMMASLSSLWEFWEEFSKQEGYEPNKEEFQRLVRAAVDRF